jgi:hypothetical protein
MIAESQDLTRITIELTANELDRISKGAMIQSTICTDGNKTYLMEIYCSFPPGDKHAGEILDGWE